MIQSFLKVLKLDGTVGNLVVFADKILTPDVTTERFHIKINVFIGLHFLVCNGGDVLHDASNQDLAFVIQQRVQQVNQVAHRFMPSFTRK